MKIRDRIRELRRVPALELRPSRFNWRTHPAAQANALRGILSEIGVASAVLARELDDGTLELIDGHLRVETLGSEPIPVLVLDVTEGEAKKLLATYDPVGDAAGIDTAKLDALLKEVEFAGDAVNVLLNDLAARAGLTTPEEQTAGDAADSAGMDIIPEKYQILIECSDEPTQAALLEELAGRGFKVRSLIS